MAKFVRKISSKCSHTRLYAPLFRHFFVQTWRILANLSNLNYELISCAIAFCCLAVIRFYRFAISPFLPSRCRFYPSCSRYAETAICRFGAVKGIGLTFYRLCRCHPFHSGGYDPVPNLQKKS